MSQSHNRRLIIVILGALSTISPFAIDMYLPAFPEMAAALHTSTARISLSVASYFAGLAAAQLFYGPLLDRFGRKLPLYAGLILFIAGLAGLPLRPHRGMAHRPALCPGHRRLFRASLGHGHGPGFFPRDETAKIISLLILTRRRRPCWRRASAFLYPCISAGNGLFIVLWRPSRP